MPRTVPRNIERMLWSEAIGHCMNPECQCDLIENGINLGECAHIVPHAEGGPASFENMILLCTKCHTKIDKDATFPRASKLPQWKQHRNAEIATRFAKCYNSFSELKDTVVPILNRNGQIFAHYGPESDESQSAERHKLWLKFEDEIISNNSRLELLLTNNLHLFPAENQDVIDNFATHTHEFVVTRRDSQTPRISLFPQELLSIFGITPVITGLPSNLSALQNFVSHLIDDRRFISLSLTEVPCLTYLDHESKMTLLLEDRHRMQQIFWNGKFFRPKSTKVRIRDLVFFVGYFHQYGVECEFPDTTNLTVLLLEDKHKVILCCEYLLSLADVHKMALSEGDIVVNVHHWNNAPISEEAHQYASQIGVRLFSQNDFFRFWHRNLK